MQCGLGRPGPGLIHHSDQGSQYVSLAFGRAARQAGIAISMGSRGDAYDNAVAETFFATLNKELVNRRSWPARLELQSAVFEYIEAFYNRHRRHSTLGMISPAEYQQTQTTSTSSKINNQPPNNPVSSEPGQVQASAIAIAEDESDSAKCRRGRSAACTNATRAALASPDVRWEGEVSW
jgi:hypothetical protein